MKANRRTKRAARQLYGVCLVSGALDESRVRTAAMHLAGSPRRGAIVLLQAFQRLVRLDRERHTALVESAAPLDAALREELGLGVARAYAGVETTFVDNPALIGGIRIKVGSDVYDGSVRARLDALASRLWSAEENNG
jgi:F-type H+-transporting ATPase subunit delta